VVSTGNTRPTQPLARLTTRENPGAARNSSEWSIISIDLLYWWTGDPFWARAAMWAVGAGFLFGMFAGFSGTAELLLVSGIRARAAAWTHSIIAVTLLSLLGANWGYRLYGYETAVLPHGILLSAVCVAVVASRAGMAASSSSTIGWVHRKEADRRAVPSTSRER
jgi:uncharacterized membrane protein